MMKYRISGHRYRYTSTLLAALMTLTTNAAIALPSDQDQPIHIRADKALRDEKQGYTVYEGNVRMQQGSLEINAQRVTVFHKVEEADRILAEGKPARMQQQPNPGEALMHARAERISYFKNQARVVLRYNASIEQDGSKVTGDSIEYLINEERIRANSLQFTDEPGSGQVEVVIPARARSDEDTAVTAETPSVGPATPTPAKADKTRADNNGSVNGSTDRP
ncbi:MAG: lipopolysaccharide transport periplasmic protein LptA [Parahaliea sp.]